MTQLPPGNFTAQQQLPTFDTNRENNLLFRSAPEMDEDTPLIKTSNRKQHPIIRRHSDVVRRNYEAEEDDENNVDSPKFNATGSIFPSFNHHWIPAAYERVTIPLDPSSSSPSRHRRHSSPRLVLPRSLKRRVFLFLTEPTTSIGSAIFFFVLIFAITVMNVVMIMQTMNAWQFTPTDCISCGGKVVYSFEDDAIVAAADPGVPCVCPPTPVQWTVHLLTWLVHFFSVEWTLRVLTFEPKPQEPPLYRGEFWSQFFAFLFEYSQILDALAIFPYYLETLNNTNGLMSFRLLRLFRAFQLLRLGQYNTTFTSLTNVLWQSMLYLKLLVLVLIFGAALFGSMMYWLEKGSWKYHVESAAYRFVRTGLDGVTEEPTPFTSIPAAFWWFMVTATTVGYGDVYPTTTGGKWVATFSMLTGVLVVAFPVSVFSDLWSKEVKRINKLKGIETALDDDSTDGGNDQLTYTSNGGSLGNSRHGGGTSTRDDIGYESNKANDMQKLIYNIGTQVRPSSAAPDDNNNDSRKNDDIVVMRQEDLLELVANLEMMRASELRIRSILSKYQIKTTTNP